MSMVWKLVTCFVAVFVAGAVFGTCFTTLGERHRSPRALSQLPAINNPASRVAGPLLATPQSGITPQLMRQFTKSLKLTPAQREKIEPLVDRSAQQFQRLRDEEEQRRQEEMKAREVHLSEVARVNNRMYDEVSELLTDEQREQLKAMRERVDARVRAQSEKAKSDRIKRIEDIQKAKRAPVPASGP